MNYSYKLCLCIAIVFSLNSFGMMRQIIRDESGFRVLDGNQEQVVQSHFVDPLLMRMNPEQLKTFVAQGNRIRAIRMSGNEYRLQAMVPGLGSGPGASVAAFWGIEALGVSAGVALAWCPALSGIVVVTCHVAATAAAVAARTSFVASAKK